MVSPVMIVLPIAAALAAQPLASETGKVPACAGIVEEIAKEIESLKPDHAQLSEFSIKTALGRDRCEVSYAHKTHRSTSRGGWTAGFPAPDPDGIAFHIHLYERDDEAGQIDTQPAMPPWRIGRFRVTFLILEGDKTVRVSDRIHLRLAYLGMRIKNETTSGKTNTGVLARTESGNEIVVEGTARDAKMGAVVVMESGGSYFIKGLDAWPADVHGKKIVVLGKPGRADFPVVKPPGPGEPAVQGFEGQPDWLTNARWRLAP